MCVYVHDGKIVHEMSNLAHIEPYRFFLCCVRAHKSSKTKNIFRSVVLGARWAVEYRKMRSACVICHGRTKYTIITICRYIINYTINRR